MKTKPLLAWLVFRGALIVGVLVVVVLAPQIFTSFITSSIGVQTLVLGIAAASLTFLNTVGGMVSLGQTALYGIAAYTTAQLSVVQGFDPWVAALIGVGMTVAVGLLFGAVICRSEGIYFLMITLAFAEITFYFFSQVTAFGSHEGINAVTPPDVLGHPFVDPTPLYYAALVCSVLIFLLVLYVRRTPFGYALQGVRDEPQRMRALGYNVAVIRIFAFGMGAFIASVAGVLLVWYNSDVSPGTIDLTRTIDLLTIAVIGGLGWLWGAWIGALLFTVVETYSPAYTDRFETIIGLVFLAVVLASPGGIAGIVGSIDRFIQRRLGGRVVEPVISAEVETDVSVASSGIQR
jgi:branched-chain amino acid transport system permease protein